MRGGGVVKKTYTTLNENAVSSNEMLLNLLKKYKIFNICIKKQKKYLFFIYQFYCYGFLGIVIKSPQAAKICCFFLNPKMH
jgi:hypothetical protein